jgi:hypothetical protein
MATKQLKTMPGKNSASLESAGMTFSRSGSRFAAADDGGGSGLVGHVADVGVVQGGGPASEELEGLLVARAGFGGVGEDHHPGPTRGSDRAGQGVRCH